jgi:hypothetical protein
MTRLSGVAVVCSLLLVAGAHPEGFAGRPKIPTGKDEAAGVEGKRVQRLLVGLIGVVDLRLGTTLLGKRPTITSDKRGRTGSPVVTLSGKGLHVEVDTRYYLITAYMRPDLGTSVMNNMPKKPWTPQPQMIQDFLKKVPLFKMFGIARFRKQFPRWTPKTYTPGGPLGARFVAKRMYDGYEYYNESVNVDLSPDGKELFCYTANFTPTDPPTPVVKTTVRAAKAAFWKKLGTSKLAAKWKQRWGIRFRKDQIRSEAKLKYVHPNEFWTKDTSWDYRTAGPVRLAHVLDAKAQSDRGRIQAVCWVDAETGEILGGDYTSMPVLKTRRRDGSARPDGDAESHPRSSPGPAQERQTSDK